MKPSLLFLAVLSFAAHAGDFTVRCAQYRVGAALSDRIPFTVKPMGHQFGATLSFLVEGEDIVILKEDSLAIDSFTSRDGKELSKQRNGRPLWEQGSFPKVSEDGTVASFDVNLKGDQMGKIEGSKLNGSIVLMTGTESKSGSGSLVRGGEAVAIGPFKVSLTEHGNEGVSSVKVVGDYAAIIEIKVLADGKEMETGSTSWSGNSKHFNFPASQAKDWKVTLQFWDSLTEQKVPVSLTIGG